MAEVKVETPKVETPKEKIAVVPVAPVKKVIPVARLRATMATATTSRTMARATTSRTIAPTTTATNPRQRLKPRSRCARPGFPAFTTASRSRANSAKRRHPLRTPREIK